MKKNNESPILNSRKNSIIKSVFTFLVIAIPALMLWIFFSNDFPFAKHFGIEFSWWIKLLIGISFIIGSFLITLLFIYLKILDLSIFIFSLPVSICFVIIFATDLLAPWARAIIIVPVFFLVIPITILIKKIQLNIIIKNKNKNKTEEKIIGHK